MRIKRTEKGMGKFVAYYMYHTKVNLDHLKRKFVRVYGRDAYTKYFDKIVTKNL